MPQSGFTAFRPPPITNEASNLNKFVDLMQRTRDLKARYLPRDYDIADGPYDLASTAWTDLTPTCEVSVSVKAGNWVGLHLTAMIDYRLSGNTEQVHIGVQETLSGDFATPLELINTPLLGTDSGYRRFTSAPYQDNPVAEAAVNFYPHGSLIIFVPEPGIKLYELRYKVNNGWNTRIKDVRFWAVLL